MRIRRLCAALALIGLAACEEKIHRLLESPPPANVRLSVTLQPASLTLPRGGQLDLTATIVRVGDGGGGVSVVVEGLPAGVTSTVVTTPSQTGATAAISVRATTAAAVGNYSLTVRGRASDATDATSLLVLSVIDPPDVGITLSQPSITIARGGIARVGVALARTNLPTPVALSISGQAGITAQIPGSPTTSNAAQATIAVDAAVVPGVYSMTMRASTDGIDRTAPLTVNVIPDLVQVLAAGAIASPQLSTVSQELIVNRAASAGSIALTAEGLPAGVTAAFQSLAPVSAATTVTFAIAGTTPAGAYPITIRASGTGADASATFTLTISAASIALAIAPAAATIPAGGSSASELSITRRDFGGAVAFDVVGLPAGLTVNFDSASVRGNRATATIRVASTVTPGSYALSVRASPAQLAASAAQTATVALTITPPTSGALVILDWAGCPPPTWVALQDGTGPWTRLTSSSTTYLGSIASATGAVAFVTDNNISVRYMTKAEMSVGPLKMCTSAGTRVVRGTAVHAVTGTDAASYSLGGGSGATSFVQPKIAIGGVRDGVHDLVGTLTFGGGLPSRVLIRRDIVVSATSDTLATVNIGGAEGISPTVLSPPMGMSGTVSAGDVFVSALSLMTTAECTVNPLRTQAPFTYTASGTSTFSLTLVGVPASSLRPTDFYLASATISGPTFSRTSTIAFRDLAVRTLTFAPALSVPTITELPGAYKRLQVAVGSFSPSYNQSVTLQYGDIRASTTTVSATRAMFDGMAGILTVPDLSAAPGWPSGAGVSTAPTGTWRLTAEGATSDGSACVENRMTFTGVRSGTY